MEEKEVFYNMLRGKVGYSFTYGDLSEITKGINVLIALKDDLQQENKQLKDKLDKVREYVLDESKVLDEKAILEIIDKENI